MADGRIDIDTRLDSKGFNDGMDGILVDAEKGVEAVTDTISSGSATAVISLETILATVGAVAFAFTAIVSVVATIVAAVAALTIGVGAFYVHMINQMSKVVSVTNQYGADIAMVKSLFNDLQGAVFSAFSPLFYAALPWIKQIISWLIEAINLVAMIIAKLTGQSTYQKYVAGSMDKTATSADKAAGATGRLAKETEKAKGAAEGALAAFDQINVLQQETAYTAAEPTGGGMGAVGGLPGGTGEFVTTVVDEQAIADQWKIVKDGFLQLISDIWIAVVSFITDIFLPWFWKTFWDIIIWYYTVFIPGVVTVFLKLVEFIIDAIIWGIRWWINLFITFATWIYTDFIVPAWQMFVDWVDDICEAIVVIVDWFVTTIVDPFMDNVNTFCDDMLEAFTVAWNSIGEVVKGVINFIIDQINRMLSGLQNGLNRAIDAINIAMSKNPAGWSWIPPVFLGSVPRLAQGAVIPPNSQFLAIMGDQRSGRNIEAPEALIRQIVREETEGMGAKDVNVNFTGTMGELIRVLRPEITREDYRMGKSLIDGATA